ncbi:MAG TPA: hypothetical protein VMV59_07580 [Candidatus Dormibacteraeota bacterium]|nr:hypothetical protein [Candidatus Dormibacteraeota bacterium]
MLDYFINTYGTHPVAVSAAVIAVIIVLIWMAGSGSRQRFIILKKTKETDQLARDISRIASALEKIAKQREIPTDYVGRPIPPGWEDMISSGAPAEDVPGTAPVLAGSAATTKSEDVVVAERNETPEAPKRVANANPSPGFVNPLGGTASLLGGKKKLDLPNPLYRPK